MKKRIIPTPDKIKNGLSSVVKRGQRKPEDQDNIEQTHDILEEFGVDTGVYIDDNILTPDAVDAAEFSESEPRGFHYEDVEEFVERTSKSIRYYIKMIEDKNWGIHTLASEINEQRTAIDNLKFQLQIHRAKGVALVDEDGEYVTQENSVKAQSHQTDDTELQNRINDLEQELQSKETEASELNSTVEDLTATVEQLQSDLQQLQEYADSLDEYIDSLDSGEEEEEETTDEDYAVDDEDYQADAESYFDETVQLPAITDEEDEVSLQQQLDELSVWGDQMQEALTALEEENTKLQSDLEKAQGQVAELQEKGQLQDDRDSIIEELTNENYEIKEQFKISEEEKEKLYHIYEESMSEMKKQESHIIELNEYIDELESQNGKMRDQINNFTPTLHNRKPASKKEIPDTFKNADNTNRHVKPQRANFSLQELLESEVDG